MSATVEQDLALLSELNTAVKLLQVGCREVQRIDGANDFYHLAMLTLASGFERLMKVIICLHVRDRTDSYPPGSPWPKHGHDLVFLRDKVVTECFAADYAKQIPAAQADLAYLRDDKRLGEVLALLSAFGQAARYYNLDVVLGASPKTDSPDDVWAKLEMAILQEDPEWAAQLERDPNLSATYERINRTIVTVVEKLARALARLFTIGGLGPTARQFSAAVHPFRVLRDDQLGTTRY